MHVPAGGRSVPRVFIGGKFVGGGLSQSSCGTAYAHCHLLQCCVGSAKQGIIALLLMHACACIMCCPLQVMMWLPN